MDYYQNVVIDYLRADRAVFVNTECCVQINAADNPDTSGPHWYCDAIAGDFRAEQVYLCEITYSDLAALGKKLMQWNELWPQIVAAVRRDNHVPRDWDVRPWLFVPEEKVPTLLRRYEKATNGGAAFSPRVTPLEMVQPWRYRSWRRDGELQKPDAIPEAMRA